MNYNNNSHLIKINKDYCKHSLRLDSEFNKFVGNFNQYMVDVIARFDKELDEMVGILYTD